MTSVSSSTQPLFRSSETQEILQQIKTGKVDKATATVLRLIENGNLETVSRIYERAIENPSSRQLLSRNIRTAFIEQLPGHRSELSDRFYSRFCQDLAYLGHEQDALRVAREEQTKQTENSEHQNFPNRVHEIVRALAQSATVLNRSKDSSHRKLAGSLIDRAIDVTKQEATKFYACYSNCYVEIITSLLDQARADFDLFLSNKVRHQEKLQTARELLDQVEDICKDNPYLRDYFNYNFERFKSELNRAEQSAEQAQSKRARN